MNTYSVGIYKTDITPPVGIQLAGFAGRKEKSTGIYHDLRAVAVAIDDGVSPVIIVGADLLGFYDKTDRLRERIFEITGVPTERIILNGSHTHCGPAIRYQDMLRFGPLDHDYLDEMVRNIAHAVQQAWNTRVPARLHIGVGQCNFATCRRKPDPDNPAKVLRTMLPYREGVADHEAPVITVASPDGELRAVIYSYACHPTSRGGLLIGADYPGYAHDYIEQQFPGVTACFLQGCGADQKPEPPDPNADVFGSRTIEEVRALGDELGGAVCGAISEGALQTVTGPVTASQISLDLETEPLDRQMVKAGLDSEDFLVREWAEYHTARIQAALPEVRTVPFNLQTVRFGSSLAIVTLAAEATVEYGLYFKRELRKHFADVLVLGYTNNIVGYIPVKRQIPEGGYCVLSANQIHKRTGPYVADTEDRIHAAVHQALEVE